MIQDAVTFCWENRYKRKRRVMEGWNREQIATAIYRAITEDGFAFAADDRQRIKGIVLAKPDHEKKTLHIQQVLGETGALKALIRAYRTMYDGYVITANRDGKPVTYDSNRLIRLIQ